MPVRVVRPPEFGGAGGPVAAILLRMTSLLKPHSVGVVAAERAARQQTAVAGGSVRQQLS
jgi:hypothetical protein